MRLKIVFIIGLIVSFWLMYHTFTSDHQQLFVSAKVYSDFGSLLPLIRYFPIGLNQPIFHPLFPDEPIRYHFLFYVPVGFLEKIGVPLDAALNFPSALGFFSLLILIFYLSAKIFHRFYPAVIAVILFAFNSSFSFVDFFQKHSLYDLPKLTDFVSFRPWNQSLVSAFWNLNIYTNQRHLAFSFAVCLLIILILNYLHGRYLYLLGFLFGSLLVLNQAGFLIAAVFLAFAFVFYSSIRKPLIISLLGFIPWLFIYLTTFSLPAPPSVYFGFLSDQPATIYGFIKFWLHNYGFSLLLIIPAWYLAPAGHRKIILPVITLFVIGNTVLLSPDIVNNHKLFNFIFILNAVYIGGLLFRLPGLLSILSFVSLTLGGIIDLPPVLNDYRITIETSADQIYFGSLPAKTVVLNTTWFYHPASLAGKAIYNGYSYFTWSYGYDQVKRENQAIDIYRSKDLSQLCRLLSTTSITHIETSRHPEKFLQVNYQLFDTLAYTYFNPDTSIKVYSVAQICQNP